MQTRKPSFKRELSHFLKELNKIEIANLDNRQLDYLVGRLEKFFVRYQSAFSRYPESYQKLQKKYQKILDRMADDLVVVSRKLFLDLDDIGNTRIDERSPKSHQRVADAMEYLKWQVVIQILQKQNRDARALVMERWIAILKRCFEAGDYATATNLVSTLNSASLVQLDILNDLSPEAQNIIKQVEKLTHFFHYAELIKHADKDVIPLFAHYKRCISQIMEGNDTRQSQVLINEVQALQDKLRPLHTLARFQQTGFEYPLDKLDSHQLDDATIKLAKSIKNKSKGQSHLFNHLPHVIFHKDEELAFSDNLRDYHREKDLKRLLRNNMEQVRDSLRYLKQYGVKQAAAENIKNASFSDLLNPKNLKFYLQKLLDSKKIIHQRHLLVKSFFAEFEDFHLQVMNPNTKLINNIDVILRKIEGFFADRPVLHQHLHADALKKKISGDTMLVIVLNEIKDALIQQKEILSELDQIDVRQEALMIAQDRSDNSNDELACDAQSHLVAPTIYESISTDSGLSEGSDRRMTIESMNESCISFIMDANYKDDELDELEQLNIESEVGENTSNTSAMIFKRLSSEGMLEQSSLQTGAPLHRTPSDHIIKLQNQIETELKRTSSTRSVTDAEIKSETSHVSVRDTMGVFALKRQSVENHPLSGDDDVPVMKRTYS